MFARLSKSRVATGALALLAVAGIAVAVKTVLAINEAETKALTKSNRQRPRPSNTQRKAWPNPSTVPLRPLTRVKRNCKLLCWYNTVPDATTSRLLPNTIDAVTTIAALKAAVIQQLAITPQPSQQLLLRSADPTVTSPSTSSPKLESVLVNTPALPHGLTTALLFLNDHLCAQHLLLCDITISVLFKAYRWDDVHYSVMLMIGVPTVGHTECVSNDLVDPPNEPSYTPAITSTQALSGTALTNKTRPAPTKEFLSAFAEIAADREEEYGEPIFRAPESIFAFDMLHQSDLPTATHYSALQQQVIAKLTSPIKWRARFGITTRHEHEAIPEAPDYLCFHEWNAHHGWFPSLQHKGWGDASEDGPAAFEEISLYDDGEEEYAEEQDDAFSNGAAEFADVSRRHTAQERYWNTGCIGEQNDAFRAGMAAFGSIFPSASSEQTR